jgi:hypothetical protein
LIGDVEKAVHDGAAVDPELRIVTFRQKYSALRRLAKQLFQVAEVSPSSRALEQIAEGCSVEMIAPRAITVCAR